MKTICLPGPVYLSEVLFFYLIVSYIKFNEMVWLEIRLETFAVQF